MEKINTEKLAEHKITSRYTIVIAAAKRARQITDGANPLTYAPNDRAVSIAVKEMSEGMLEVNVSPEMLDGSYERMLLAQNKYKTAVAISKDDLREDLKDKYEPASYSKDDDDDDYDEVSEKDDYLYGDDGLDILDEDDD
jgi:DNA-directed RNA polymerase subunit omega